MSLGMHETCRRALARSAPSDSYPGELGVGLQQSYSGVVALFAAMRGRSLLPSPEELEPKGPAHFSLGNIQAPPTPPPTAGY